MDAPKREAAPAAAAAKQASKGDAIEVLVVSPDAAQGSLYAMFEASDVTIDGARLTGGMLLELDEEITLELLLPERASLRVRATVVEIQRGNAPAMRVSFDGLEEADKQRFSRYLSS